VSCAALDQSTVTSTEDVQVMLVSDENAYLLCTLRKGAICQVPLDLNFAEGDKISFSTKGTGIVHLTGYLIPDNEDFDMDDESDDEEGEDNAVDMKKLLEKIGKKTKPEAADKKKAKKAEEEDDSDDDDAEEGKLWRSLKLTNQN
jgi:FK506-binding nuclear protein